MARHPFGGFLPTIATLVLLSSFVGAELDSSPWDGNATGRMCDPPVLLLVSLGLRDNYGPIMSVGGLNQTAPLFGVDYQGHNWTTKWVNLTKESPEIQFLFDQEGIVGLLFQGYSGNTDFVSVRLECPITDNITCVIKYTVDSDADKKCNNVCREHLQYVTKGGLAQWIEFDLLRNHSKELQNRWGPICEKIANISDPGHMHLQSRLGNGWFSCEGHSPSPTRFWLTTNATMPPATINATYTRSNETGWAHLNVSTANGTGPFSCSAESVLGWSVTQNSSGDHLPSSPQLQKLVGRRGPAGQAEPKDDCGSHEFQFLVVVLIISFLVLLVIYLFFKERIHVWVTEKVLSRFGSGNKPVSRAGFRPVI